jgi:hypothetical protein
VFIYGALVENKDDEARADIDALLRGEEPASVQREKEENYARILEFAFQQGEVRGEVSGHPNR